MKRTEKVSFTPSKFAALVGIDRHELQRKLTEHNARPVESTGRGELFTLRDLHNAATGGDQAAEKLRKLRAECAKLEHDLSIRRREFVRVEDVQRLGERIILASKNVVLRSDLPHEIQDKFLNELAALGKQDWRTAGD